MSLSSAEIRESQQLVIDIFKGFRDELLVSYGSIKHDYKQDGSHITELDLHIEKTIKAALASKYPHIGFHGEETEDVAGKVDATWIVDPIDGTSSFVHGLPYCTNMAGLVVDGVTVACVIYQFVTDDLFTAIRNEGAFKNGERIHVSDTELKNSLVFSGSFAYKNIYPLLKPHGIAVYAPIGASGYEFTRLAGGNIQGVTKLRCNSQMHDDVPGVLLVQEAGGEVISFTGEEYDYSTLDFVVATPTLASLIRDNYDQIKDIITH